MFALLVLLLLIGAGVIYEAVSSRTDALRYPPPGEVVDVGGYRLHLNCRGEGSPVVVLDAGLGDSSAVWAQVQEALSPTHRVCSYDRAGIAWSERSPQRRSAQVVVEELHTLLHNAGEKPPYVLVGHSAGVNTVRLFAAAHPEVVSGLVLIEPPVLQEVSPIFVTMLVAIRRSIGFLARLGLIRLLGKAGWMGILFGGVRPPVEVAERAGLLYNAQSIQASIDETRALPEIIEQVNRAAAPNTWGAWPVRVIGAYSGAAPNEKLLSALITLAQLSSQGRVISVKGSHLFTLSILKQWLRPSKKPHR